MPAFSLTALTALDLELNIRGITNTRLDSPSADPSVGTFVDGVYIGRTGDYNFDFYDLERIEVIRGPQGVLLGKNVVGGALSIITAAPKFENSGEAMLSFGNYDAITASGHVTGGLTDDVAGRFSFQARKRDGYARDVLHNRDVEDLDSFQGRAQLLWEPGDSGWHVRGIVDYSNDSTNGINTVAVDGGTKECETSYLRTNCTRPWSNLRAYLGITDPRENIAQSIQYKGKQRINQFMERDGSGLTLDVEKDFSAFTFNSLTGYRQANSKQVYDQTGAGPEALGWSVAEWSKYIAWMNAKYGTRPATSNNGQFLFAQPVGEAIDAKSFSQEFRAHVEAQRQPLRLDRRRVLQEGRHREDRPIHRRELPRRRHPGRQQPAVDAERREPLGERGREREHGGLRPGRLQVHRFPQAQRRSALHVGRQERHGQRPRSRYGRPLQPERPAPQRDDGRPVPRPGRHHHPHADGRHGCGRLRRAQPVDLLGRHRLHHQLRREVDGGHAAGHPRVDHQRRKSSRT